MWHRSIVFVTIIRHNKSTYWYNKLTYCCDDMSTCCNDMSTCCDDMSTCCDDMSTCCNDMSTCCNNKSTCEDLWLQNQLNDVRSCWNCFLECVNATLSYVVRAVDIEFWFLCFLAWTRLWFKRELFCTCRTLQEKKQYGRTGICLFCCCVVLGMVCHVNSTCYVNKSTCCSNDDQLQASYYAVQYIPYIYRGGGLYIYIG